jgi:aminoglycoside phosphotransferase (APT) family kinase protein
MALMNVSRGSPVETPDWIAALFEPGRIDDASRIEWGFRNEVWRVGLDDGRRLAVTRFADTGAAASIVALTARLGPRLHAAGVPSATVISAGPAAPGTLVTDFVDGTVGAALLGEPGGATLVGSTLGATWRRLARVDTTDLGLDGTWLRPNGLAEWSRSRLERAAPILGGAASRRLAEAIDASQDLLAGRRATFVHGDLVPVNVILRNGKLAALVDFEFARVAEPLLDAAWFDSVVAFHHPAERGAAWQAFLETSGIDVDDAMTRDLLRILPMLRYLEILEDHSTAQADASHWIAMLQRQLARS